nr:hypothetical protein BaRGS_014762 [Batillaria attramentaria]
MSPAIDDGLNLSRAQRVKWALIRAFKRTVTFLFSQVGLTSVVVGYVIFGGVLFMAIEAPEEMQQRKVAVKHQEETLGELEELIMDMMKGETGGEVDGQSAFAAGVGLQEGC